MSQKRTNSQTATYTHVIVINKSDLASEAEIQELKQVIGRLNSTADILVSTKSRVPLEQILGTGKFQFSQAEGMSEWLAVPRGAEETETEEYGISSFVYQSDRPFHPQRIWDAIGADMESGLFNGVLRSKGLAWIASRNEWAYNWSQAGCSVLLEPAGFWWASAPQDEWPEDEAEIAEIESRMVYEHGDRHQELVFIGQDMNKEKTTRLLDACLLTDEEYQAGAEAWSTFQDPMPLIEFATDEEVDSHLSSEYA